MSDDHDRLVDLAVLYYKYRNYNDFNRYSNLKYSYWKQSLIFICGLTNKDTARVLFNKMVKQHIFKKVKEASKTYYVFDIYNEHQDFHPTYSFKMTFT